jgi:threonine dehydrogenase-like Zn-dependent dehydrogenase
MVASLGYLHHEFPLAMDLISAGHVRVEPLHDMTVTLAELPSTMAALGDNPSHAVKVLVDPR